MSRVASSLLTFMPQNPTPGTQPNPIAVRAVQHARMALGTPYVWGGTDYDSGVDCSGLCFVAYRFAGHGIPRTSEDQYKIGRGIAKGREIPGDLIFSYAESNGPGHVVMSIGGGQVIAADHTGTRVRIESASRFDSVYVGSRRVVPSVGEGPYTGQPIIGSGSGGGIVSDVTGGISALRSGFDILTDPHTWYRVGQVILGAILVVFGLLAFSHINPVKLATGGRVG